MSTQTPPRSTQTRSAPVGPPPRKPFRLRNSKRRVQVMIVLFGFVVSLFAARLVELQVLRGDELAASALSQRLVTEEIPATRGAITDVNGRPLAISVEVRDITADQTLVEDAAQTAAVLGPIVDMPASELAPLLEGDRRFIYLKKKTVPQVWRDIQKWKAAPGNDATVLQGIFSERRTIRDYPNGPLAANVIGFTNAEGDGSVGLEAGLNGELSGEKGRITYEQAAGGTEIPTSDVITEPSEAGTDVRLTIDSDLQWTAQQSINRMVKNSNSDFGMVVALEVGTGKILAMATGPGYDPRNPGKVKPEEWTNKPVTWAMEPGSTGKLMTIAAVLEEGAMKPKTRVVVPGSLARGGKNFTDSHAHGTEQQTLAGVLAMSSNIGTILAAEEIGEEKLYEYLRAFGVAKSTGLQYPGEQSGYIPPTEEWSDTTFPTLAFGQGMSMTALQIANMVATIGNDGVRVEPRLIDGYTRPDGTVQGVAEGEETRVVSSKTARTMQDMMQLVLQEGGTAPDSRIPGYLMGGKTGTAQRYDQECGCYRGYTASFVGMAPADDPQIVVGAWLDHPKGAYYGGQLGGPVVQEVMTAALASQGVAPTGSKPARYPIYVDGPSVR